MVIEPALLYDNDARDSPGLKRMFRLWLSERPARTSSTIVRADKNRVCTKWDITGFDHAEILNAQIGNLHGVCLKYGHHIEAALHPSKFLFSRGWKRSSASPSCTCRPELAKLKPDHFDRLRKLAAVQSEAFLMRTRKIGSTDKLRGGVILIVAVLGITDPLQHHRPSSKTANAAPCIS